MSNAPVEQLFKEVNKLVADYQKINELTGDNFNVFKILKLEAAEVRMHSAFLAELLNPRGSHGQKDIFLKLFVESFGDKNKPIDTPQCSVFVEKYLGPKDERDIKGGRLDICIRDKSNRFIVIENKIFAPEQPKQLERYHNEYPQADLFYLTLDGSPPSDDSKGPSLKDKDFKCISYNKDILNWLEACRKEVAVIPMVREAVSHYINLIKHLTNQATNHQMEQKLTSLTKENFTAAFAIAGNLDHAMQETAHSFGVAMVAALGDRYRGLVAGCNINLNKNYTGIWLSNPNWKYIRIEFQFWARNRNMVYGLTIKGNNDTEKPRPIPIPDDLMLKLRDLSYNERVPNEWWAWYNFMDESFRDWNNAEAYDAIADGRMHQQFFDKIDVLLKVLEPLEVKKLL